jgi:lysozyme
VAKLLKPVVVSQKRYDALVSFAYNCGVDALAQSTLLRLIKKNQEDPAIREAFMAWNKITKNGKKVVSPGLAARRAKEADLWFSDPT